LEWPNIYKDEEEVGLVGESSLKRGRCNGERCKGSNTKPFFSNKEERVPKVPSQEYRQRESN